MSVFQTTVAVRTQGRGTYNLTREIASAIRDSGIETGTAHLFVQHTSAGIILSENADPDVRRDLETFMRDLVPDGDSRYLHQDEGPDDMPAHIRSILAASELTIPVSQSAPGLGIWQGIYLWEHRTAPHHRKIIVTVQGHAPTE